MRLCPSSPELDPSPPGHTSVAERSSNHVEFNADAHRKMTRAVYSVVWPATASSTRTPVARCLSRSYRISVTIANGLSVSRPVAIAGGNVEDCVLKYPPDRKSTRLNSSHSQISYAVFCLQNKT